MTRLYAGVDGGASKTAVLVTDQDGRPVGRGQAGPATFQTVGHDAAFHAVRTALADAMAAAGAPGALPDAAVFGLSGAGRPDDVAFWERALAGVAERMQITSDAATALVGAHGGGPGVIVIAGTGSIALGQGPDGATARAGGQGWLADDFGSGFDVGRRALYAVVRAHDGRAPQTLLTERIFAHWGLSDLGQMIARINVPQVDKAAVAALARLVAGAATEGDAVALGIWHEAGRELAELSAAVIRRLGLARAQVAPIGSLWQSGALLRAPFAAHLDALAPGARLVDPQLSPAEGAALMARRLG